MVSKWREKDGDAANSQPKSHLESEFYYMLEASACAGETPPHQPTTVSAPSVLTPAPAPTDHLIQTDDTDARK